MSKLIIRHKGKIIKEVSLKAEGEISVGRGAESDIILPNAPGVSRRHLLLSPGEDGQWLVKNLSKSCELSIEGEEKEEGLVCVGEFFQAGDFQFNLLEENKEGLTDKEQSKAPVL